MRLKNNWFSGITIPVEENLSELITCDQDDEVDPHHAGMTWAGVRKIWQSIEKLYQTGVHPAITISIRKNGKRILKRSIGHSRGRGPGSAKGTYPEIATPDTPVCLFSASKSVTAMAVHLLVEDGDIHLLDPVSHFIPEFGKNGKENITVHDLLTHRSGIPILPEEADTRLIYDHEGMVALLCSMDIQHPPARRFSYNALGSGYLLNEIIRRVKGKDLGELIQERIAKPLGMRYFSYGVQDKQIREVATNYFTGLRLRYPVSKIARRALGAPWEEVVNISNQPEFMQCTIPSANLVATADEMCRFYILLLNGGELDGVRIFDPLTIERALIPAGKMDLDHTLMVPMRYTAGFMLGADPVGMWGAWSKKAFGHVGFMNILTWADPRINTAIALMTTGKPLFGSHLKEIVQFVTAVVSACGKDAD